MYAIIATGGKQYKVEAGDILRVEKLSGNTGDTVSFDNVLMTFNEGDLKVGQPKLENVSVQAHIVEQDKSKKVIVFKYKRRKRYRRKRGHRQMFTAVKIDSIEA